MLRLTCLLTLFSTKLMAQEGLESLPTPPREEGVFQMFVMIGIMIIFFYFILWRPEQKKRKELEKQRSELQKGDRVAAMGILGEVFKVQEETVILKMVDGAKIEFLKAAVTDVLEQKKEN